MIGQYQALFEEDGVELSFTDEALRAIATKAKKSDTGARALRMIVETLLMDLMYEIPSDPTVKEVTIEESCILHDAPPTIKHSKKAS